MSEVVKLRTRADIEEEAAAWIWRLESGSPDTADPEGFDAWLRQDPRHRRAVDELSKVWESLDGLAQAPRAQALPPLAEPSPLVATSHRLGRRPVWFAAAAALVAAVAGAMWLNKGSETQVLATAVGQHGNVVLADGSIVSLNTNTIVETNFGRHSQKSIYARARRISASPPTARGRSWCTRGMPWFRPSAPSSKFGSVRTSTLTSW